jgi:hypothetical protein
VLHNAPRLAGNRLGLSAPVSARNLHSPSPKLEMIHVDQHMPMQDLVMSLDARLNALCSVPSALLAEDLEEFRLMFTF